MKKLTYKDLECEWCHGAGEISRDNSDGVAVEYTCDECNGSGIDGDIISHLVSSLKECCEDSEFRCRELGLDPSKYSTTMKANELLKRFEQ